MTKYSRGFTVIEILFVASIAIAASVLFFIQKNNLEIVASDNTKKTAINAMYYSLEESYYPANKYYPQSINSDNLKTIDPALLTDPSGVKINETNSAYTYIPTNCQENKCKSYTLKATLKNEAEYIKTNKN